MNIGNIIKDSISVVKNNLIIIIPPILVSLFITIFVLIIGGGIASMDVITPGTEVSGKSTQVEGIMGIIFFIGMISFLLQIFSHGMMISMADEVMEKSSCSLSKGFKSTLAKLNNLMIAAIIIGILMVIGIMLFVIPALVVSYVFMYSFVLIILEDINAINALKKSYILVRENLSQTFILFIALAGTGFLIAIINMIVGQIPIIGQIAGVVFMSTYLSFFSVVLLKAYRELQREL